MSALLESVSIRDAEREDLDAIAALEKAAFPVPWKREYFETEIGAPHRMNRVACGSRGDVRGYVFCAWAGGEVHVNKIAVSPLARRRGVAARLMSDVFVFSASVKAEAIYLEVRLSNQPARIFYRGLGFVETGRRSGYYFDGEDALVMVKELTTS